MIVATRHLLELHQVDRVAEETAHAPHRRGVVELRRPPVHEHVRIRVPAEAEIVIEGRLLPHVREPEGPFGEFPQYYGARADRHVIEIDAVMQRRDAMFGRLK